MDCTNPRKEWNSLAVNLVRRQRIDGETNNDQFGAYSIQVDGTIIVGATGEIADINNDGILDLIVGAGFAENGEDIGKVYIFFGDGTGRFNGTPILDAADADIIIEGEGAGDFFGASTVITDVNGDGLLDLVIGAPGADHGAVDTGSAYVFLNQGAPSYFATDATGADHRIDGNQLMGNFGSFIATADFNGDGRADLVIGAPLVDIGTIQDAGAVYVFFNQGPPNYYATIATNANQTISASGVDEGFGINILPTDVNGDGSVDLIIGSPLHSPSLSLLSAGAVYIFINNGLGSFPTTTAAANQTILGSQAGMQFGSSIDAGDLGLDGDLDLIGGAPFFNPGTAPDQGALFIFYNNGNLTAPFFAANTGLADHIIDGENPNDRFGRTCIIADMDLTNGPDIFVGAPRHDVGTVESVGAVYLFLNKGFGVFAFDAAGADLRILGEEAGDRFGSGIRTGDLTNNGLQDVVIGARLANFGGEDSGSIYSFIQERPLPPPPSGRSPAMCEAVIIDRVVSDEIFYLEDDEFDIPIGEIRVPPGSTIDGVVTVTVLQCVPRVELALNRIFADIVFMVQKELLVTTPDELVFPLEFGFRLERTVEFRKSFPVELELIDPDLLLDLECRIVNIAGTDVVTLHPSTFDEGTGLFNKDAAFDEELTVRVKVKVVQERQVVLPSCSPRHQIDIGVSTAVILP